LPLGNLMFLKVYSIFALLGQIFVLRTTYFRGETISRDSSSTEMLYSLNRNLELII